MAFNKINTKKTSIYIIEEILKAIQDGEYQGGEKLPSERKVAEEMGVSRPSVREAYSALRIAGIIETRSGDGTYINNSVNYATLGSQALRILREHEDPYEIWKAREVIETGLASLVTENVASEEIEEMEETFNRMQSALEEEDYDEFFSADHDLHLTLGKAAHNQYLEDTISSLVNVMQQELWQKMNLQYYLKEEENAKESLEMHRSIFRNLKKRNPSGLESALTNHFGALRKHIS